MSWLVQVRVSFLSVPLKTASSPSDKENEAGNGDLPSAAVGQESAADAGACQQSYIERICFNVGREIYVYDYGSAFITSFL
jgi:hypothetical protein